MSPRLSVAQTAINGNIVDKVFFPLFFSKNLREQILLAQVFIILYVNLRSLDADTVFSGLFICSFL